MQVTHRGYFIPPRPLKYMGKVGSKLKEPFIEARRQSLELYLHRLCCHPCAPLFTTKESDHKTPLHTSFDSCPCIFGGALQLLVS